MRYRSFYIVFIVFFVCFDGIVAQTNSDNICFVQENVILNSDRNLYVIGESIQVSAVILIKGILQDKQLSSVLYVELYNESHQVIASKKIAIKDNIGKGSISIPKSCTTGRYMIHAYTRYMENFSADIYSKIPVFVINPSVPIPFLESVNNTIIGNNKLIIEQKDNVNTGSNTDRSLIIHTNKDKYGKREKINLSISSKDLNQKLVNVAVVKKGTYTEGSNALNEFKNDIKIRDIKYIPPEILDVTLRGRVINKDDASPIVDEVVIVSIVGNNSQIHFAKTNKDGEFYIVVNDVYDDCKVAIALKNRNEQAKILVNDNFSKDFSKDFYNSLVIDSTDVNLVQDLIANSEINNNFHKIEKSPNNVLGFNLINPEYTREIDDFIQLNSLKEFFFEILPIVKVKKINGISHLEILRGSIVQDDNPIVLLDNIPINDIEELLKIRMEKIAKIELFNEYYILGDYAIRSLMKITTKEGRFGNLNIPDDIEFFDYEGLDVSDGTGYIINERLNSSLPYFNTTLYWSPNIEMFDKLELSFYSSDYLSEYDIIVSGVTAEGSLINSKASFIIK